MSNQEPENIGNQDLTINSVKFDQTMGLWGESKTPEFTASVPAYRQQSLGAYLNKERAVVLSNSFIRIADKLEDKNQPKI